MEQISSAIMEGLVSRGLDEEMLVRYGVHSVRGASGEACVFPFIRDGLIVNRKYRTSVQQGNKGKIWQDKGGIKCFFNEDVLRDDTLTEQPLIITEGEIDALTAIQCGFQRTVSVPDGAPAESITDENSVKYSFLEGARPFLMLERVREVILAVDNDEPGMNLLHDLSVRLGKARCKFLTYPKHPENRDLRLKDLNEVLQWYGPKGVVETINRAQWMSIDGVYRMGDLPPVAPAPTFDIGFPHLSQHYRVRLGDMAVFTGIPSMGKSSFVNDLCCRLVDKYGLNVSFASFEQMPQRDHRRNLRTWFCGKPTNYCDPADLAKADKWIDEHFTFMVPGDDDDVTLDWVLDRMEAAVIQHDSKVIVIDPWNEMDHARQDRESLTEYTGRAIKAFKRFAKKFMVHLIIVAHPAKQQKDKDGAYAVPTLYDISDSAHWYNKADVGVVVHRFDTHSIIRVAKSRYHDEIGTPGEVKATFEFERRRFSIWGTP